MDRGYSNLILNIIRSKGLVIAIRDKFNRIFFGEQKYFIPVNEDNVCMQ